MRKAGADNRIELTMRVLNRSAASGDLFVDRRQNERRKTSFESPPSH